MGLAGINENYDHRHVSHHYDVWPGHRVTWEDNPELAKAIQISNRKRAQQNDSAHGIIHRLFTAIRLKDLCETAQNLYQLMNHGFITRALHTTHNPYRLHFPDLQGAMPAILLEISVYSAPETIEFLPAMPASLAQGAIDGVWLYTWTKLEHMQWTPQSFPTKLRPSRCAAAEHCGPSASMASNNHWMVTTRTIPSHRGKESWLTLRFQLNCDRCSNLISGR